MFQLPDSPQTVAGIYRASFHFWKIGFKHYFPLMFICAAITALPHFFIPELNTYAFHITAHLLSEHKIFILFYSIFVVFSFNAILYRITMILRQEPDNVETALWVGFKKLPLVTASFIISLLTVFIAFAFFALPGIIFAILLSMYFALIIIDNEGLITAFRHSCDLVWNNWWRTAVVLVIPTVLYWIAAYLIEMATADVAVVHLNTGGSIWLLHNSGRVILNILYFPWFCALMLLQLNDLLLRNKEPPLAQIKPAILQKASG